MSRWWFTGLALFLFAAAGCDLVATALTERSLDRTEDTERSVSPLYTQGALQQADLNDGESSNRSKLSDQILTPVIVSDSDKNAGLNGDSQPMQGFGPAVVNSDTKQALTKPEQPASQLPDVASTSKSTPSSALALVPTPYADASASEKAHQAGQIATGGEDVPAQQPRRDCIRPGHTTLWLEPSDGEWTVSSGQTIEVKLCLSNLSTDLAGFDLVLAMGHSGVAEFTKVTMGKFGLQSFSELPSESLRLRAIDLKQVLNAGTDGISLATLLISITGAGESPLTIQIKAIDDKEGYSVTAEVVEASLSVTEDQGSRLK